MKRTILNVALVSALSATLLACASATASDQKPGAGEVTSPDQPQDGPVFEGSAEGLPGSFARLVLEKDFQQTKRLRWQSNDTRIGGTEVDYFEPRQWQIEGDSADTITFLDRSPGPILSGAIRLSSPQQATVHVKLGRDRVTYTLDRVESDSTD